MNVEVKILGPLEKPDGRSELSQELDDGSDVACLLSVLGYKDEHVRFITISVNDEQAGLDRTLEDGDLVTLSLLVGGG